MLDTAPFLITFLPFAVRVKAVASRQEHVDMAHAAGALRLLMSLPAAAVAVAWEAFPVQDKDLLQRAFWGDFAFRILHRVLLRHLCHRCSLGLYRGCSGDFVAKSLWVAVVPLASMLPSAVTSAERWLFVSRKGGHDEHEFMECQR